jgi:hypothetical protein
MGCLLGDAVGTHRVPWVRAALDEYRDAGSRARSTPYLITRCMFFVVDVDAAVDSKWCGIGLAAVEELFGRWPHEPGAVPTVPAVVLTGNEDVLAFGNCWPRVVLDWVKKTDLVPDKIDAGRWSLRGDQHIGR